MNFCILLKKEAAIIPRDLNIKYILLFLGTEPETINPEL